MIGIGTIDTERIDIERIGREKIDTEKIGIERTGTKLTNIVKIDTGTKDPNAELIGMTEILDPTVIITHHHRGEKDQDRVLQCDLLEEIIESQAGAMITKITIKIEVGETTKKLELNQSVRLAAAQVVVAV